MTTEDKGFSSAQIDEEKMSAPNLTPPIDNNGDISADSELQTTNNQSVQQRKQSFCLDKARRLDILSFPDHIFISPGT